MPVHLRSSVGALAAVLILFTPVHGQDQPAPQPVEIPDDVTLEGRPTVRVESTQESTIRRTLTPEEAALHPLKVRVRDGRYFWESQEDRPLEAFQSGAFTYLSSEPGRYIRLTRYKDKITYVEHLDWKEFGSITWWGEVHLVGR